MTLNSLIDILRPTHMKIRVFQYFVHLAIIPAVLMGEWKNWLLSFFIFYFMFGVGSGMGAHRYWSHKLFNAPRWLEIIMAFAFTIAAAGSVIGYVVIHRRHHAHSDDADDPHSPQFNGILYAWLGLFDKSKLKFSPKLYMRLLEDPVLRFFHDYYYAVILGFASIAYLISFRMFIFMFCIPVILNFHANSCLIVLCHTRFFGYKNFQIGDCSVNLFFPFKFLLLGEELHNNHHYSPASLNLNLRNRWSEVDLVYFFIQFVSLISERKKFWHLVRK